MSASPTVMFTKNLGAFQIDATIEETHNNSLAITKYPVEKGTEISDHAQILPKQFDIICGVSNVSGTSFSPGRIQAAYAALKAVQESREPFSIQTNLTTYNNMLIEHWTTHQDKDSAHVMIARAHCKEVIIVGTQNVSSVLRPQVQEGDQATLADQETQNKAAPTVNRGDVSTQEPEALTGEQVFAILDNIDAEAAAAGGGG